MVATLAKPEQGDYYHDGQRMIQVISVNRDAGDGWIVAEDIVDGTRMEMPESALTTPGVWKWVRHGVV